MNRVVDGKFQKYHVVGLTGRYGTMDCYRAYSRFKAGKRTERRYYALLVNCGGEELDEILFAKQLSAEMPGVRVVENIKTGERQCFVLGKGKSPVPSMEKTGVVAIVVLLIAIAVLCAVRCSKNTEPNGTVGNEMEFFE